MARTPLVTLGSLLLITTPVWAQTSAPWPKIKEFGGATPTNEGKWFTVSDYPGAALREGLQGNVIVRFDISAAGRAENCIVEATSGHTELDRVPCAVIERQARFKPAQTADGEPMGTHGRYSVAFWQPN